MKQDQMSMAASIESRVPFLDHKLVEFAARMPESMKVRGMTTKYVLRRIMTGVLPPEILSRRKMGFPVPIASWLYALGVARFAVHHAGEVKGIPLQTWVFPQDREKGYPLFEPTTRRALEFFSERIGPFPYEKLANVQAAGMGGGTEHATAIFSLAERVNRWATTVTPLVRSPSPRTLMGSFKFRR